MRILYEIGEKDNKLAVLDSVDGVVEYALKKDVDWLGIDLIKRHDLYFCTGLFYEMLRHKAVNKGYNGDFFKRFAAYTKKLSKVIDGFRDVNLYVVNEYSLEDKGGYFMIYFTCSQAHRDVHYAVMPYGIFCFEDFALFSDMPGKLYKTLRARYGGL